MKHVVLTPREAQVAKLLARHYSQAEIAALLEISPRTVEHHAERIRAKAGVSKTRAAIRARARAGSPPVRGV